MGFIEQIAPYAQRYSKNVFPSITIAQAILESGWGKSRLARDYNNYFGIKGNGVVMDTLEDDGSGNYFKIQDGFRVYDNLEGSFKDHDALFTSTPYLTKLYRPVREAKTPEEQARALQGTYATDTRYASKLMELINRYNLKRFDEGRKNNMTKKVSGADVIRIARKYLGVKKYSTEYKKIYERYNNYRNKKQIASRPVPNFNPAWDWCALFVSSVLIEAGMGDKVPLEVSVGYMKEAGQRLGQWIGKGEPRTGDIVIFDNEKGQTWPDHVGFVNRVEGNTVITVEGNVSNPSQVKELYRKKSDRYIQGYIRPPYGSVSAQPAIDLRKIPVQVLAQQSMNGNFGNGDDRKRALGSRYEEVQAEINKMLKDGKKPIGEVAKEVRDGKHGNGMERINNLKDLGYSETEIAQIQSQVNLLVGSDLEVQVSPNQKAEHKLELDEGEYLDKDGVVWIWKKRE